MNVLLIRPPSFTRSLRYPAGPRFGIPLGLLQLAASIRADGFVVEVYDALIDFSWDELHKSSDGYFHIGASWERLGKTVAEKKPDVVGITNPFADFAPFTLKAAEAVQRELPDVTVVVGGPHATVVPEYFLAGGHVDFVFQGEAERSFSTFLRSLERNEAQIDTAGISWRENGQTVSNPRTRYITDLDSLPFPAYDLVPMERYFELVEDGFPSRYSFEYPGSQREISLVTSRGCPFHCVFCGNHRHMGRKWRYHSVEYVLSHMTHLIECYGVKHFHIEDDNLSLNRERLDALLDGILERGWQITWDTPNGVRADRLTEQQLRKMKKSGCTYLILGVESGDQRVLDEVINKKLKLTEIENTVRLCYGTGLDVHAFYIVGFPGESRQEIFRTFRFAKHLLRVYGVIPHLCLARPLPGTPLFDLCLKEGYLTEPIQPEIGSSLRGEVFARQMITTEAFTPQHLEQYVARFNRQVIFITLIATFLWLLRHPYVWPVVAMKLIRDRRKGLGIALKRVFFGGLFYKNNYLNRRLRRRILIGA